MHVNDCVGEGEFGAMHKTCNAKRAAPRLFIPATQVNVRAVRAWSWSFLLIFASKDARSPERTQKIAGRCNHRLPRPFYF